MAGSSTGGLQARDTNRKRYGRDYYKRIGQIGGSKSRGSSNGGFYVRRDLASMAGMLGGTISRRGPNKISEAERLRIRKEFQKNYQHLLNVNMEARKARKARGGKSIDLGFVHPNQHLPLPGTAAEADYKALEGESDEQ